MGESAKHEEKRDRMERAAEQGGALYARGAAPQVAEKGAVRQTARYVHAENGGKYGESALNFYKIVYIYALGGLVGTVWETTFEFLNGNGFVWCNGSICTPFNFVYGAGGVVIILCLRKRKKWREVFLIGSIGAGAVEYVLSFLDELFLGTRSWDYSDYFLNIDGRTNIPYMLFFGALCVVVVFLVWQPLNSWLDSLPKRVMKVLAVILAVHHPCRSVADACRSVPLFRAHGGA